MLEWESYGGPAGRVSLSLSLVLLKIVSFLVESQFCAFIILFSRHDTASKRRRGAGGGLQLHQHGRLQDPGGEWASPGEWNL